MSLWEARLRRIDTLLETWPFAGQILRFHRALTEFQRTVKAGIDGLPASVPELLTLVEKNGPPPLAERAGALKSLDGAEWNRRLQSEWKEPAQGDPLDAFFVRVLLQPAAAEVACRWTGAAPAPSGRCPVCRHLPVVSVLRDDPQADALARSLVCSLCSHEWSFTRVACPQCGEENADKLPRYTAQEIPWVRIEACESCTHYLKAVDLSKDGHADPVTDEIGATPLDLLAHERSLTKIQPNILGM